MEQLLSIMRELREKCPWDQQQTPESLTQYAIEEAYEVEAAVRSAKVEDVRDELGDLLLQVVFQAQMYSDQGAFDFQDVVQAISDKLIRRHPHVFQAEQVAKLSPEDVSQLWQDIKQKEKQGQPRSRLDEVKHAPALRQAEAIQKNVAKIGFDFADVAGAYGKLEEELAELKQAVAGQNSDEIQEEFGDCLFSLVNVGRKLGVSSEMALLGTIHKFRTRFALMEHQAAKLQLNIESLSLAELDQLWEQAKLELKQRAAHEYTPISNRSDVD